MPGIVGAFGVGDLPTVFVAAGRIADGATAPAAGPDSLWRVYSMTKPVTAMAAMILIEDRSEEHTSELQSLMRISYAVFCLKKKITRCTQPRTTTKTTRHRIPTPNHTTQ